MLPGATDHVQCSLWLKEGKGRFELATPIISIHWVMLPACFG